MHPPPPPPPPPPTPHPPALLRVCLVLEEFVRLLHHCGMSLTELDICNGRGQTVNEIMAQGEPAGPLHSSAALSPHSQRVPGASPTSHA